jgi:hypothetical protein
MMLYEVEEKDATQYHPQIINEATILPIILCTITSDASAFDNWRSEFIALITALDASNPTELLLWVCTLLVDTYLSISVPRKCMRVTTLGS